MAEGWEWAGIIELGKLFNLCCFYTLLPTIYPPRDELFFGNRNIFEQTFSLTQQFLEFTCDYFWVSSLHLGFNNVFCTCLFNGLTPVL